jgi:ABC-2 type transport system ATP-binding protein
MPTDRSPAGLPIEVRNLTKRFGPVLAIDDLSFQVAPGRVTGFLGPNGAGKTTTLRSLLGLVRPTAGQVLIGGRRYTDLPDPLRTVGAALEATGFHPGRTARDHLRVQAVSAGLPSERVGQVLSLTSLEDAARRRVGGFSLGMRQRLALATALLGDPPVLLLDEPANGLDPEGIVWLRGFLRFLADQGRTVLVSSHVLSEVQQTVDDVVIIAQGRLIRQATLADLDDTGAVLARTPSPGDLLRALATEGLPASIDRAGRVRCPGRDPARVGAAAFRAGVELHELRYEASDLEATFLALTSNGVPAGPDGPDRADGPDKADGPGGAGGVPTDPGSTSGATASPGVTAHPGGTAPPGGQEPPATAAPGQENPR